MVRHEAAEALGGIASDGPGAEMETGVAVAVAGAEGAETEAEDTILPPGGVLAVLREWAVKADAPQVVRESCQVAIDMWEVSLGRPSTLLCRSLSSGYRRYPRTVSYYRLP
jgi:deoxyhypusine monooxygenase